MAYRSLQIEPAGAHAPASAGCEARVPARVLGALALLCALVLACTALAAPAYALVLDAPTHVADDITRLQVDKRDADTHEPVVGATLVIVDENDSVVAEWTSNGSSQELEKLLDVGVVYTLKELKAPDGYSAISPISFTVDPLEGNGITIVSGDESQYDLRMEFTSLREGVHNKLNVYDRAGDIEAVTDKVVTRGAPKGDSASKEVAPKTGDETPLSTVAVMVLAGVAAILLLEFFKRRLGEE